MEDDAELSVGLSVTCSTSMDDCYDVNTDRVDEPCASTSSLPFNMVPFITKSVSPPSASMAVFYPQLTNYDIPIIMNQRHRDKNDEDHIDNEHIKLEPVEVNESTSQKHKGKQKVTKRRNDETLTYELLREQSSETSDFSTKNRKAFFCRACGKAFKFQTSLLRHNNKVHISKYQCPTCNRVFFSAGLP
uniref:C2H2-type domain-containing protein n=1 Tax=Clastoptera arizonana TaxID=38151 RepID=A0A1B6D318_9HEMI